MLNGGVNDIFLGGGRSFIYIKRVLRPGYRVRIACGGVRSLVGGVMRSGKMQI